MAESPEPSQPSRKQNPSNTYLRYSGLAIQLLATIAVCGWIGYKLDQWLEFNYPIFMITLGLLGFGGVMYQLYRSINRP